MSHIIHKIWFKLFPDPRQRIYLTRSFVMALVIRLAVFGLIYIAERAILDHRHGFGDMLYESMRHWDAKHYMSLADLGYRGSGDNQFLLAFFPLFPYLVRVVNFLVHDFVISAILVSFASTVAAGYLLQDLLRRQGFDEDLIFRAFMFFCCFPTAIYFSFPFTEGLFLALTLLSFYAAQGKRWLTSGVAGAFASATRSTGVLLLPALALSVFWPRAEKRPILLNHETITESQINSQINSQIKSTGDAEVSSASIMRRLKPLWLLLIPLGLGVYLFINWRLTGDPLMFMKIQAKHWGQGFIPPWEQVANTVGRILHDEPARARFTMMESRLIAGFIGIALMLGAVRRLPLSWQVYGWMSLLVFMSAKEPISLARYLVVLFPIYPVLAIWTKRPMVFQAALCLSTLLMAAWSILYLTGHGAM